MARVAAEIKTVRKSNENVMVLDCGDLFFKKTSKTDLRPKTIFSLMKKMEYDAINVAEGEISFGQDFFLDHAKQNGLTFVSANLTLTHDDARIIKPFVIRKMKGFRVAITGIIAPIFIKDAEKKGVGISNTLDTQKQILFEVKDKADFTILLSHLGYEATVDLLTLNDIKGIDLVIAGHGRHFTPEIVFINKTVLVQNSLGGEHLGKVTVNFNESSLKNRYKLENLVLTKAYADDGSVRKILDDLIQKERSHDEMVRLEQKKKDEEKEALEVLKLSPEEFILKMKKENKMQDL